jgi:hypothetical protein
MHTMLALRSPVRDPPIRMESWSVARSCSFSFSAAPSAPGSATHPDQRNDRQNANCIGKVSGTHLYAGAAGRRSQMQIKCVSGEPVRTRMYCGA